MSRFNIALFFTVIISSLFACKKGPQTPPPIDIVGKWDVQKLISTVSKNGVQVSVTTDTTFRSSIDFYQFYSNGTGIESLQDPSFPLTPFKYIISGSVFYLSHQLDRVPDGTFTISKPSDTQLIINDTFNYKLSGDNYQEIDEMILVEQP
jgi:hypothetical protein